MITIVAPNIRQGGGLTLLNYLLEFLSKDSSTDVVAYCDSQASKSIIPYGNLRIIPVKGFFNKLLVFAKWDIKNVIYFGNLPPFSKSIKSVVYLHNPYLVSDWHTNIQCGVGYFAKYCLQRIYIYLFIRNVDHVCFQTPRMLKLFEMRYSHHSLQLAPFFKLHKSTFIGPPNFTFCYVSLPSPHKNHSMLLDAIELLAFKNFIFSIAMTVPFDDIELCARIASINAKYGNRIHNFGKIPYDQCVDLYGMSRCLVFPSSEETLGLPLLEATYNSLHVIAPKLDYVTEVLDGYIGFDANSISSLVSNMENYINYPPNNIQKSLVHDSVKKIIDLVR